ncbi:MAG: VWA domain-containing protein [bacterium]
MKSITNKIILMVVMLNVLIPFSLAASTSPVICRIELDRGILPAGEKQKAVLKVTLDAPEAPGEEQRPPVNLSIVLDRSGSMAGTKLENAKKAAIEALRRLGDKDIFSLVIYDHNVETIVPAQSARNTEWIEGRIRSIHAGGNTALFGGVSQGASEIRKNLGSGYTHRIILLSDGLANVGPSGPDDLGRLGSALVKENISVTTVGVGTDYNEDLMTRLSQNSDGNSYFVESDNDLSRIFAAELGDVLSIVAKKVILKIRCSDGVSPVSIIGREGRIKDGVIELYLNQLYGKQQKYALIEVEISSKKSDETKKIATANISYENAVSQKTENVSADVIVKFSKNQEEVNKSINIDVQREYNINISAVAQDKAISLADQGKKKEAIKELKGSIDNLRTLGKETGDKNLINRAREMEAQVDEIEEKGWDAKNRKILRTDSYQMIQQQKHK